MDDQNQEQAAPAVAPGNFNINPAITVENKTDENENPTGGFVRLIVTSESDGNTHETPVLQVLWQDGPRGQEDGTLAAPNGAFVEDVIYAAIQRLEFFQGSKYQSDYNAQAINNLKSALEALDSRSKARAEAGTLGKHEV